MSCHYPSCMMGGGDCRYEDACIRDAEERAKVSDEKRKLDLEEQRLRIKLMKQKLKET